MTMHGALLTPNNNYCRKTTENDTSNKGTYIMR